MQIVADLEPEPEPELSPLPLSPPPSSPEQVASSPAAAAHESSRKVLRNQLLTNDQLWQWREEMTLEISTLLNVSRIVARRMLAAYNWDTGYVKTEVCDEWFSHGSAGIARVLTKIGEDEAMAVGIHTVSGRGGSGESGGLIECMVCFEKCEPANGSGNRCGHFFCNECWGMHLSQQIADGNVAEIKCMDNDCKVVLADEFIAALAPPQLHSKIKRFSLAEFVEEHPLLKKCRNPECTMTLRICDGEQRDELPCDNSQGGCGNLNCGHTGCWEECHFPCPCKNVRQWHQKCDQVRSAPACTECGCSCTWLMWGRRGCRMVGFSRGSMRISRRPGTARTSTGSSPARNAPCRSRRMEPAPICAVVSALAAAHPSLPARYCLQLAV